MGWWKAPTVARALILLLAVGAVSIIIRRVAEATENTLVIATTNLAILFLSILSVHVLFRAVSVQRQEHALPRSDEPVPWTKVVPGLIFAVLLVGSACAAVIMLLVSGILEWGGPLGRRRVGLGVMLAPAAIAGVWFLVWAWNHRVPIGRRKKDGG